MSEKRQPTRRSWPHVLSTAALALALPALLAYNHYGTPEMPVTTRPAPPPAPPQPAYTVSYPEINVEEYTRLGLTPQQPVQIIPLDGKHNHKPKTLHGRFLHITDIHPDEFYVEGGDIEVACHRGNKKKGGASKYGDAMKGCDSPLALMNGTMTWIEENLKDKIDFVIWSGDNIRHDNDRKIPRTEMEILEMNREVSNIFHDLFHGGDELDPRHYDVPVVPSLGNNDVYPHNLFAPGPTLQTREMWTIWQNFVPQEQMHIFERGVYYFNEVIPNQLAVLSINTLYLYKANPLVDSCDRKKDPGYQLLKWLGITLQELRARGMKVWLSGHVPPIPKNYDISCFRKFALWQHEYRDIIIGGVYGHMNVDHFIPVDAQKAYKSLQDSLAAQGYEIDEEFAQMIMDEEDMSLEEQYLKMGIDVSEHDLNVAIAANEARAMGGAPSNKEAYMDTVRETYYADIKSKKNSGVSSDRYVITNVAASIVPTFNPGMRVWEYNITGVEQMFEFERKPWAQFFAELEQTMKEDDDEEDDEDFFAEKKKKKNKKKKEKAPDVSIPEPMPKDTPLGPGYTPQTFSPTRFVQYYADLESINAGKKPMEFEVEYTSDGAPYSMSGLLVDDFVALGRKLGAPLKGTKKKSKQEKLNNLWETFKKHAFVSSGYRDEDQDDDE